MYSKYTGVQDTKDTLIHVLYIWNELYMMTLNGQGLVLSM